MTLSDAHKSRRSEAGFAYLWVLLLVACMGLGLTLAVEIDTTALQRERERELLSIGRQFRDAIRRYYEAPQSAGTRQYPATLEDLLQDRRSLAPLRHLRKVFVDPMTGKAQWGLVRVGERIVGVHSLSERTPIKQDGFDASEPSFTRRARISEWVFAHSPQVAPAGARPSPGSREGARFQPPSNDRTVSVNYRPQGDSAD